MQHECNDGTRPVIFKIERIDIPEKDEERKWLEKQNFRNSAMRRRLHQMEIEIPPDDCRGGSLNLI